ncbi:Enhancer of polycomb-like protein 1 [Tulasnella sp. 419]|nr:Enhancer of polycomb-like protein 1 [Tulasnella sp. 419]
MPLEKSKITFNSTTTMHGSFIYPTPGLLEECQTDVLAAGYSYVMDERDADWLDKITKLASGEGPSNGVPSTPRPDASARRSAKSRGKAPEASPSNTFTITEDEFELVMGLLEKVTDEKMPFLHLTPTDIPLFSDFESFFGSPVPPHHFPDFLVPPSFPQPAQLTKLARAIYPHWRDRKVDRAGHRIIPQLNYDESNEGDPYVCFRHRELKPVRKT